MKTKEREKEREREREDEREDVKMTIRRTLRSDALGKNASLRIKNTLPTIRYHEWTGFQV